MSTLRVNSVTNVSGNGPTYAPGHIIQTVSSTYSTTITINSTSWLDSLLNVTITPKSSTSKVAITYSIIGRSPVGDKATYTTVFRGTVASGTNLGNATMGFAQHYAVASVMAAQLGAHYVDSPNTTAPVTYTVAARNDTGSCGLHYGISSITVQEIAV